MNATLQEALELLASEPVLDRFLAYLLQKVVEQFAAHSSSLLLPDEARKRAVIHLTFQDGRIHDQEAFSASPIAQAFSDGVEAQEKWALFQDPHTAAIADIEDSEFPGSLREALRAAGVRALTATPLCLGESVIGRLVVRFDSPRALSAQQIELLQSIANQMAVALHMSRLAEEVRRAAVLDERNRMARDIHDTLAQGFTGVIVQLEAAKDAIARRRGRDTREHIQRAADLARQSLAEARRSVRALKPLALEHGGLQAAFAALLANVTAGTGLTAHFACSGAALRPAARRRGEPAAHRPGGVDQCPQARRRQALRSNADLRCRRHRARPARRRRGLRSQREDRRHGSARHARARRAAGRPDPDAQRAGTRHAHPRAPAAAGMRPARPDGIGNHARCKSDDEPREPWQAATRQTAADPGPRRPRPSGC